MGSQVTNTVSIPPGAVVTNIGPLTTIFTPPETCTDIVTVISTRNDWANNFFVGYRDTFTSSGSRGKSSWGDPSCLPEATASTFNPANGYYSPGACPAGYFPACTGNPLFQQERPDATVSICCQLGYKCFSLGSFNTICTSTVTRTLPSVWITDTDINIATGADLNNITDYAPGTQTGFNYLENNGVVIMYENTDTDVMSLMSITATPTTDASTLDSTRSTSEPQTSVTSSIPSRTGDPSPTEAAASSGLSTGAKAGIGVGTALGVAALLAVLAFFFLRRRKGKKILTEDQPEIIAFPKPSTGPNQWGAATAYGQQNGHYPQNQPQRQENAGLLSGSQPSPQRQSQPPMSSHPPQQHSPPPQQQPYNGYAPVPGVPTSPDHSTRAPSTAWTYAQPTHDRAEGIIELPQHAPNSPTPAPILAPIITNPDPGPRTPSPARPSSFAIDANRALNLSDAGRSPPQSPASTGVRRSAASSPEPVSTHSQEVARLRAERERVERQRGILREMDELEREEEELRRRMRAVGTGPGEGGGV